MEVLTTEEEEEGMVSLLDDIPMEMVYHLEIDGIQEFSWDPILMEEEILYNLHFRKISEGLQVGTDLPTYPSVSNDWYHGPSDFVHVQALDWKEIDVSFPREEPKLIKVDMDLEGEELKQYRSLIMEYQDVFAWSYLELKGLPRHIAQYTIPVNPDVVPVKQRQQ